MDTNDDDQNVDAKSTKSVTFPIPAAQRIKRTGMDFYTNTLGAPKYVVSLFASSARRHPQDLMKREKKWI